MKFQNFSFLGKKTLNPASYKNVKIYKIYKKNKKKVKKVKKSEKNVENRVKKTLKKGLFFGLILALGGCKRDLYL